MFADPPLRERWQPVRGGLINLFKYEDQIFRYENGRLLLRGDNGSGKSRVLALQLPFLLDGEISPYRVEPDRDPAKRMEWHLLMDRHERRTGYTWIELAVATRMGSRIFSPSDADSMRARVGGHRPGGSSSRPAGSGMTCPCCRIAFRSAAGNSLQHSTRRAMAGFSSGRVSTALRWTTPCSSSVAATSR